LVAHHLTQWAAATPSHKWLVQRCWGHFVQHQLNKCTLPHQADDLRDRSQPLRQVADAEHQAKRGDIILSPKAQAVIHPTALRSRPLVSTLPKTALEILQGYLSGAVRKWLNKGLRDWVAEWRPMSVLFISVEGLDYDQPDASSKLHNFVRGVQETLYDMKAALIIWP
jgi:hypothetical protein